MTKHLKISSFENVEDYLMAYYSRILKLEDKIDILTKQKSEEFDKARKEVEDIIKQHKENTKKEELSTKKEELNTKKEELNIDQNNNEITIKLNTDALS